MQARLHSTDSAGTGAKTGQAKSGGTDSAGGHSHGSHDDGDEDPKAAKSSEVALEGNAAGAGAGASAEAEAEAGTTPADPDAVMWEEDEVERELRKKVAMLEVLL